MRTLHNFFQHPRHCMNPLVWLLYTLTMSPHSETYKKFPSSKWGVRQRGLDERTVPLHLNCDETNTINDKGKDSPSLCFHTSCFCWAIEESW